MSLDAATKAVFVAAGERRKQRGIQLKRVCFMADASQVETFNMVWEDWVHRFGKEDAVDFLLASMCESQVRLMEYDRARRSKPKRVRRVR